MEWEREIGRQLRALRLRKNIDQKRLAEMSGIALNAVKRLESGRGTTLKSLIKVLRSLEREDWLASLMPQISVSPMQMLKNRKPERCRVSRARRLSDV
jgi:transcriptional regulator with XRE-family HTH domain